MTLSTSVDGVFLLPEKRKVFSPMRINVIAYRHLETFVKTGRVSPEGLGILYHTSFIAWNGQTWVLTTLGRTVSARHGWKASFWVDLAMTLFGESGAHTLTSV